MGFVFHFIAFICNFALWPCWFVILPDLANAAVCAGTKGAAVTAVRLVLVKRLTSVIHVFLIAGSLPYV